MSAQTKFNKVKARVIQLIDERPLETVLVAAAAATATAKLINSITEARNSSTWKREVHRREQNRKY